ncbi:hypothetical protein NPIL_228701 [Nephila pilipes]|uniref:Uncharacterized protein n=1 Tax=Nephila pilipes TaxID=299642 RepID=A0A8X6NXM1_NEPPI|nr:hypothetical protein NPIL_228701 [Nephila pilipes]
MFFWALRNRSSSFPLMQKKEAPENRSADWRNRLVFSTLTCSISCASGRQTLRVSVYQLGIIFILVRVEPIFTSGRYAVEVQGCSQL